MLLCTVASLFLGLGVAYIYMYRSIYTKNFVVTLALLPAMVQIVIMLVNGNIGTGIAVMGAFSLVRFRSVPGSAREISSIFLAMAVGLATGMGYLGAAAMFLMIIGAMTILLATTGFGEQKKTEKELKITIHESLDYSGIFDDLFERYTKSAELIRVKTTNMGSLYELQYHIVLTNQSTEKELLDQIRCRNGNLNIACGRVPTYKVEL
ncbi:cell dividion protein FtsZ [Desulforamulus aquiferis]|nr:cell dividion protein FtsZ [Desulforamulus aquiferis]